MAAVRAAVDAAHLEGSRGSDAEVLVLTENNMYRTMSRYGRDPYPPHHIPSSSIVSDVFAVLAEKSEPLKARAMRQQLPDQLALAVSPLSAARLGLTSR